MKRHLGLMLALVILTVTVRGGAFESARQIPRSALSFASGSVKDFAIALAYFRVPAGVIFSSGESSAVRWLRPPNSAEAAADSVNVEEFVRAFNANQQAYSASFTLGVVNIVPVQGTTAIVDMLNHRVRQFTLTDATPAEAYTRVLSLFDPGAVNHGVIGTGVFCQEDESARTKITVAFDRPTIREILNSIVSRAPGMVWVLRSESDGKATFGYLWRDQMETSSPLFSVAGRKGADH